MGVLSVRNGSAIAPALKMATGFPASGSLPMLGSVASATGLAINQGTAVGVSTVYACVSIRSKDVARCTPRLLKANAPRSQTPIKAKDHAVAALLKRPNWIQTWFEFAYQMEAAFLLRNNAYAAILRDGAGRPYALIPINPDAVTVLEALDGSIFYQVNRVGLFQMAALKNFPGAIPAEDVLHLRGLTFNMLVGVSTIVLARDAIGVAMGLEQQRARWMANAARPSGVLKSKKRLDDNAAARLRTQWESFSQGLQNVGRTAILEEEMDWQAVSLTAEDLLFIEQCNFSVQEIARFWGMPLHKLGVPDTASKARLDQADQAYVNTTIMPDLDLWEQKFEQMFDLDKEDLVVNFDETRLLRAEAATRINTHRLAVMSGLETQNEGRADEGRPPLPGGDVLLSPVNLAAAGSDRTGTAPDGAGRPEDGDLPDPGAANEPK
ncbi:MAG: phage portal protein [Alphaproteobacteria bacterium]|nr:MAG: phage portal protein [Alphaproteobacteria bacterium]